MSVSLLSATAGLRDFVRYQVEKRDVIAIDVDDLEESVVVSFKVSRSSARIIEAIVKSLGTDKSTVIRMALAVALEFFENNDPEKLREAARNARRITSLNAMRVMLKGMKLLK
ncbi:hypothetical protein J4526_01860 [Desulfurococcaceae archaeon MEX13E-LK6-19]|nr:hypothetical protein J4526_01860 [Desulfurococcaceae archaeon MEX13E-LK6-19]